MELLGFLVIFSISLPRKTRFGREYCSCPSPYVRSRWSYEAADVIARIGYRDSIVFAELVAALMHGENG